MIKWVKIETIQKNHFKTCVISQNAILKVIIFKQLHLKVSLYNGWYTTFRSFSYKSKVVLFDFTLNDSVYLVTRKQTFWIESYVQFFRKTTFTFLSKEFVKLNRLHPFFIFQGQSIVRRERPCHSKTPRRIFFP